MTPSFNPRKSPPVGTLTFDPPNQIISFVSQHGTTRKSLLTI